MRHSRCSNPIAPPARTNDIVKTLLLLRHAKSSWDDSTLDDHDRPLKPRGIKAARRMGRLIREQSLHPELILCSTAVRARQTLHLLLDESGLKPVVELSEQIFHCPPSEFAIVLQGVGETIITVMLVGHNPGMEEFLFQLTGQNETFPTAALAVLELDLSNWLQFSETTRGRLVEIWRPKELQDEQ